MKCPEPESLGLEIGIIKEESLICEDALFFEEKMKYSLVAKTNLLVYRMENREAINVIPKEC